MAAAIEGRVQCDSGQVPKGPIHVMGRMNTMTRTEHVGYVDTLRKWYPQRLEEIHDVHDPNWSFVANY